MKSVPVNPIHEVAATAAAANKRAEDELAQRMAMDVSGDPGDPFKAAVEKIIPGRVDIYGNLVKDSRSI